MGAIVAGATILAGSVAFAGLWFGNTQLVNDNGAPQVKVVVGESAAASDGVAAANIAAKIASEAFKTTTLTAQVMGEPNCEGAEGAGSCAISNEEVTLEVTVPGSAQSGTYTMETFIGDVTDKGLRDRGLASGDINYSSSNPETSLELAHPFANGDSNGLLSGVSQQGLFKIDGTLFSPFETVSTEDVDAGKEYQEEQYLFVRAETQYRENEDEVQGRFTQVIYQAKFTHDDFGIPVCTDDENSSWSWCSDSADDNTGTHKVPIYFLGKRWVITKIDSPETDIDNETGLARGGEVNLAKESISGIINVGETLEGSSGYSVRLDDIKTGDSSSEQQAIVSILDSNGNVVKQDKVSPGSTKSITVVGGESIMVRVYKTAPGYTFGAKWADMALITSELKLKDAETPEINKDSNINDDGDTDWRTALVWRNKDTINSGGSNTNYTDHLRSIIVYKTSNTDWFGEGQGFSIIEKPAELKMTYRGLDMNTDDSDDYDHLQVTVEESPSGDEVTLTNDSNVDYELNASSLLRITSEKDNAFSTSVGSGNELLILFDAATNTNNDSAVASSPVNTQLRRGTVLIKTGSAGQYAIVGQTNISNTTVEVDYTISGDGATETTGGVILLGFGTSNYSASGSTTQVQGNTRLERLGTNAVNFTALNHGTSWTTANAIYSIMFIQDTGEGISSQKPEAFGFLYNVTKEDLNEDVGAYEENKVRYAGPALYSTVEDAYDLEVQTAAVNKEEGFVTERGTVFDSLDDNELNLYVAKRVVRAQYFLAPSETSVEDNSAYVYTLSEGESVEVDGSDITILAKSIDEDVGGCAVGAGAAPVCDTSGQSAVIMPNNAASVEAVMPMAYSSYAPLVLLDRDALGTDAVVTVGGPAVNRVTTDVLAGSDVDFNAETKVVKEVVSGKKIVVAGLSADDTMAAAQDFIAQLRRQ